MRTCPRCEDLAGPNALYCSGCGCELILHAAVLEERKRRQAKRTTALAKPRIRCPFCGAWTRSTACPEHLDLAEPAA